MRRAPGIDDLAVRAALWDMADEYNRGHLEPVFGAGAANKTTTVSASAPYAEFVVNIGMPGAIVMSTFLAEYHVATVSATPCTATAVMSWDGVSTWEDEISVLIKAAPGANPDVVGGARHRTQRLRPGKHTIALYAVHANFTAFDFYYQYRLDFFVPAQNAQRPY